MKKGLAILSISTLCILLIWGLCFFSPVTILVNAKNWLLGKTFNGFILFSVVSLCLLIPLLIYILTGGERKVDKEKDQEISLKKQQGLMETPLNIFSTKEEELKYLKYKRQLDGPSIFHSKDWIHSFNKSVDLQPALSNTKKGMVNNWEAPKEGNYIPEKNEDQEPSHTHVFLQLDLDNLSQGLVEIPNPEMHSKQNSLEKNIDLLLHEQNSILNPLKSNIDSVNHEIPTDKSGPHFPYLKVVHNSSQ